MTHEVVSIGFDRDDGVFQVLATLNNRDEHIEQDAFDALVRTTKSVLEAVCDGVTIRVVERQDAPDYVDLDDE